MQKLANTHEHHVIPVSLGGRNIPENIIRIQADVHRDVHRILNIPYGGIRDQRMMENEPGIDPKLIYRKKAELTKKYFENIMCLPEDIMMQHVNSLIGQVFKGNYEMFMYKHMEELMKHL